YRDRINFFKLRKSKASRALFAELHEFHAQCSNSNGSIEQLEKQIELYSILKAYMTKTTNEHRELYKALKPLYLNLEGNIKLLHQQFIDHLKSDPKAREAYLLRRVKRVIQAYKNEERSTKSAQSLSLVKDLETDLNPEVNIAPEQDKSTVILNKYNQEKNRIGASLDLSLAPLMDEISSYKPRV
ncbi:MAG TPA: hypothetical protein VI522_02565, partial [Gammaproteobacteria bacterium]|nr:hypothetical protein [Gammaproteobacteria bacterium]